MSIVAPITAVGAAVLPVTWGLAKGERPGALALTGVVIALVAVAFVAAPSVDGPPIANRRREVTLALIAGAGFGTVFILFGDTSRTSGLWPLLAARVVSALLLVPPQVRLGPLGVVATPSISNGAPPLSSALM